MAKVYGIVKIVVTAIGLMAFTEQIGRKVSEAMAEDETSTDGWMMKWSLIIGSAGQAFAMFYIGVNQAVHPPSGELDGHSIFAIVCVYLFVVFYSFGWGPTPFILSSECSPNHVRSLLMAAALMVQWLFNFVIAKITPLMLADIGYGTFLLFGSLCVIMGVWTVLCVPETKGVRLESIGQLFEGEIIRGCIQDTIPSQSRARKLREQAEQREQTEDVGGVEGVEGAEQREQTEQQVAGDAASAEGGVGKQGMRVQQRENV